MELHFCSQCGISIPLSEVQSGAAAAGEGRLLCAEHRAGAGRAVATAVAAAPAAGGSGKDAFELLFCANCQVSIPVGDVENGRAKREFGSLLCPACSAADHGERDRRRKAVEAEMAEEAPALARRCSVCSTGVAPSEIASGRASADGDRVVCGRCRDAAAAGPALHAGRAPSLQPAQGPGATSLVLVILLMAAFGAAGFFGAEYFRGRKSAPETSRSQPAAELAQLQEMRGDLDRRIAAESAALAQRMDALEEAQTQGTDRLDARFSEALGALREEVADMRVRLGDSDRALSQRLARLEGQVESLQEMTKGLAARPANGGGDSARGQGPPPGPENQPPPVPPPAPPPVPQVDPQVTTLIKALRESPEPGDRFSAANELMKLKARSAIPVFAERAVSDSNIMVRRSCAKGLGELRAWYGVPVLIQVIEDPEAYVAAQANFAIQAITGQDFGVTVEHSVRERKTRAGNARKWWEKNKDTPPDGVCLEPVELARQ